MPDRSSPYRQNIPRWGQIIGVALLFIAQYFISGLNGDVGPRVTSYFGLDSSKVSFYLHISTVGFIAVLPLAYRFRAYFRRVKLLLLALGAQFLISLLCRVSYNETILLISSLLMGGLKIICIIDFLSLTFTIFPFLRNRGLFYGLFYGFSRIMREFSTYTSLSVIDGYDWTATFLVSAIAAAISIVIVLILFHKDRLTRKIPLYQMEWRSFSLIIMAGGSLCYTLTMGREKNWWASDAIVMAAILCGISTLLFVYRQFTAKRPFWDLRVFKMFKQVPLGFALMLVMYLFYATSFLYNTYIDFDFSNEEHYLEHIGLIHILSYAVAFPLAGYLFYKGVSKRLLLGIGFMCYAFSLIYFCEIIQTDLSYWQILPPYVLESIAYAFTLTTSAAFMATNIPRKYNKDRVMGSITSRYILGSFVGYSLYSNWLFRGKHHATRYLSENITPLNDTFRQQFNTLTGGFLSRGSGLNQAHRKAMSVVAQKVDLQAMLITIRDITCIVGVCALVVAFVIFFVKRLEMHNEEGKNKYRLTPW